MIYNLDKKEARGVIIEKRKMGKYFQRMESQREQ